MDHKPEWVMMMIREKRADKRISKKAESVPFSERGKAFRFKFVCKICVLITNRASI